MKPEPVCELAVLLRRTHRWWRVYVRPAPSCWAPPILPNCSWRGRRTTCSMAGRIILGILRARREDQAAEKRRRSRQAFPPEEWAAMAAAPSGCPRTSPAFAALSRLRGAFLQLDIIRIRWDRLPCWASLVQWHE